MSWRKKLISRFAAHDRIFLFLVGVQGLVLAGIAVGFSLFGARQLDQHEQVDVQEVYKHLESDLTTSLYSRQMIKDNNPNVGNPALKMMQESLDSRGIKAHVTFVRCSDFLPNGRHQKLFGFSITETKLDFCMVVEREASFFVRIFLYATGAVLLILLLELLLWFFIRDRLETQILNPQKIGIALGQMAHDVVHDIKSPLVALESLAVQMRGPEEDRTLLLTAINRIKKILATLRSRNPLVGSDQADREVAMVGWSLRTIVDEKKTRQSLKDFRFEVPEGIYTATLFASINALDFERVLSNLVENAIESEPKSRSLKIEVETSASMIEIQIKDDGKGIPPDVLARLGKEQLTHGKKTGSGIGFFEGKKKLNRCGGDLTIESELGKGTTVRIKVPRASIEVRVAREIELDSASAIVIVDDDRSQHEILAQKVRTQKIALEFKAFFSAEEFAVWRQGFSGRVVVIMDFDLGPDKMPGLDWIEGAGTGDIYYLHTSYQDRVLFERCAQIGVPFIPKGYLYDMAFRHARPDTDAVCVLIDDEELVLEVWRRAARKAGVRLETFASINKFEDSAEAASKETTIYCDDGLGGGTRGSDYLKELHKRGYRKLHLVTGQDPQQFAGISEFRLWPRGKYPPW